MTEELSGYTKSRNFPALTGYRALAALLVFFHHFNPFPPATLLHQISNEGHLGVTLFFVLSGFLIAYRYADSYSFSLSWWGTYVRNRFARIYPVFFLITVLGFRIKNEINPQVWILNLTMTKAWFDDFKFTGIGPAWSLSVEEAFYLLAPFLFFLFRRFGFWLSLGFCYVVGLCLLFVGSNVDFYGFFTNIEFTAFFTFWGRAFEFLLGIELALRFKSENLPRKLSSFKFKTYAGIFGIFLSMCFLSLITSTNPALKNATSDVFGIALNNIVLPPFIALLIWGLIEETTLIRAFLSSKPLILMGGASYVFYLAQQSILGDILHALGFNDILTQFFPALILISVIIYLGFEQPMQAILRTRKKADKVPKVAVPS